jgi:ribosomal protein L11 methylase PrmA
LVSSQFRPEPGSFRDPSGRVFHASGKVYRALDQRGLTDFRALESTGLLGALIGEGNVVATRLLAEEEASALDPPEGRAGILEHEAIPFLSYPFEWTFSMLRAAALLQLDILERALAAGLTLKDATPYNIQFRGARPVFIDVGSFQRLGAGEPWVGYRQFCRQFLYPLMMRAHLGIPFQPWLRGDPEGPSAADISAMMSGRDLLRSGVAMHVSLQARAERRFQGDAVRDDLRRAGFSTEMILANVRGLRKVVEGLAWDPSSSEWSGYAEDCKHVAAHRATKETFLRAAIDRVGPGRVLDLGANDGFFSRAAAESCEVVVAADADELVLDRLFESLAAAGSDRVQPLLVDLSNPSPRMGWRGQERSALAERARPDLVVAYAVIHHLVVGRSVPLAEVVGWLADFGCPVVLEWVGPEDPMARRLAANKRPEEIHLDYREWGLSPLVEEQFVVQREEPLPGGTRALLLLIPR